LTILEGSSFFIPLTSLDHQDSIFFSNFNTFSKGLIARGFKLTLTRLKSSSIHFVIKIIIINPVLPRFFLCLIKSSSKSIKDFFILNLETLLLGNSKEYPFSTGKNFHGR
jgi:hypothetical protein